MDHFEERITREQWDIKYQAAKKFMKSRHDISKVLIQVGAQHPLDQGMYPNEEFRKRLLLAKDLFLKAKEEGKEVEIYVPGSRHMHKGVADQISLSQAGVTFLINQGLNPAFIHGEDLNEKYKGKKGVYNSADECFVAACYFQDENFGQLYSVVSPLQIYRKAFHYLWFGILPLFYTAPTEETYHDYVKEIYDGIPHVRDIDPDMQSENSYRAIMARKERMPKE
jgi:hypothetical protein